MTWKGEAPGRWRRRETEEDRVRKRQKFEERRLNGVEHLNGKRSLSFSLKHDSKIAGRLVGKALIRRIRQWWRAMGRPAHKASAFCTLHSNCSFETALRDLCRSIEVPRGQTCVIHSL